MLPTLAALAFLFAPAPAVTTVCAACVKAHVEHLAAPALNGRRCATTDEARAADYLVGELKRLGISGAMPGGGHLQTVSLQTEHLATPATLSVGGHTLIQGRDFQVWRGLKPFAGSLLTVGDAVALPADVKGAVVVFDPAAPTASPPTALSRSGAAAVIMLAPGGATVWAGLGENELATRITGEPARPLRPGPSVIYVRYDTLQALKASAGGLAELAIQLGPPVERATHNVVGVIHGSAADADHNAVVLTAHYDHLGVRLGKLYPGANDDASGTAAVLEFARLLEAGAKPKRTVVFALFGCEEEGGFGATYFDAHPALPIADIKANIEFEMIGFRDPQHSKLMMTGYERSNLGPTLADHGAKIEQDPYPAQNFFQRSDNYALARVGVVAHTISAWPTPPTYHQPTDTASSVDFPFMAASIQSLVGPVRWLLNSHFTPSWNPGGKP